MVATASKVLMSVIDINNIVDIVNCVLPRFCVIINKNVGRLLLVGA